LTGDDFWICSELVGTVARVKTIPPTIRSICCQGHRQNTRYTGKYRRNDPFPEAVYNRMILRGGWHERWDRPKTSASFLPEERASGIS
jgi:hypothetical protein